MANIGYTKIPGFSLQGKKIGGQFARNNVQSLDEAMLIARAAGAKGFHLYLTNNAYRGDMYLWESVSGFESRAAPRHCISVIFDPLPAGLALPAGSTHVPAPVQQNDPLPLEANGNGNADPSSRNENPGAVGGRRKIHKKRTHKNSKKLKRGKTYKQRKY